MAQTARAIVMSEPGGPDVLRLGERPLPAPGPGELRLRQTAIGVNYHDVYVRSGLYRTLALPGVPGLDGAGVVEAVGPDVTDFAVGDRVGYVDAGYGGYAEARNLKAALAVPLPDSLTDAQAAASLMKAMTACVLLTRVRQCRAGETVLVHAAAGGMGQLMCGWASRIGATVIGTVGTPEKAEIARACGAHHTILYREDDFVERVMQITGGTGVAAAYDSVGADTFSGSLKSLDFLGHLVLYGQSSGPVEPVSPSVLSAKSLTLSRPILFHYIRTKELLAAVARESFAAFASGAIRPIDPIELPLGSADEAHRLLEARQSPGGIVLVP